MALVIVLDDGIAPSKSTCAHEGAVRGAVLWPRIPARAACGIRRQTVQVPPDRPIFHEKNCVRRSFADPGTGAEGRNVLVITYEYFAIAESS